MNNLRQREILKSWHNELKYQSFESLTEKCAMPELEKIFDSNAIIKLPSIDSCVIKRR